MVSEPVKFVFRVALRKQDAYLKSRTAAQVFALYVHLPVK